MADQSLPLSSMTGYGGARGQVSLKNGQVIEWAWETKSVNAKGLDVRLRLPPGFDRLEFDLRKIATKVGRGTVSAGLMLEGSLAQRSFSLDEDALAMVSDAISRVRLAVESTPPSADGILAIKGVLNSTEESMSEDDEQSLCDKIKSGFEQAITALVSARAEEGQRLQEVLSERLDEIERLSSSARAQSQDATDLHFKQLKEQIQDVLKDANFPEDRLIQEAAVIAVKSDIREEVDRLDGHVVAARQLITSGGLVGRKLDFLAQEFVREANTLTTKAPTMELKQIGLGLKGVIDQFKEQVQNIA